MKIGIMLEALKDLELKEVVKKISSIGYSGVEFFASKGNKHIDLDSFTESDAIKMRRYLREHGIEVLSICNSHEAQLILGPHDSSTDHLISGTTEEKIRYGVRRVKRTIEVAQLLEAPVITVFTGCPNWGKWYPFPDLNVEIWEKYFELFAERWLPILDYAKDHDVKLAFEGEPGNLNYNIENTLQLIKSANYHKSLGICYDPSHIMWQGIDPVRYIYELRDRIFNVHLKDVEILRFRVARTGVMASGPMNTYARSFRFRVPGWGDLPWKKIISSLYEVGYKGPFIVELEDSLIPLDKGLKLGYEYAEKLLSAFYD